MKVAWRGRIVSVQPRITLGRSFNERWHEYLGYVLTIEGVVAAEGREFAVAIGKAAHTKHQFRVADVVSGQAEPRLDSTGADVVELHKASGLRVVERPVADAPPGPPWCGTAPALDTYRERGCRRLDARTYAARCRACLWGCLMPVTMIVDHWKPDIRRYRTETFCYGPKSCRLYRAGPTRKVPGRRGMTYEEEDWVDRDETSRREDDE